MEPTFSIRKTKGEPLANSPHAVECPSMNSDLGEIKNLHSPGVFLILKFKLSSLKLLALKWPFPFEFQDMGSSK